METIAFPLSKRVKLTKVPQPESKELQFNFETFFGDIREDKKQLRDVHCKDFYSLFEVNSNSSSLQIPFSQVESVLFLTFAVSREMYHPLVSRGIPVVLVSDCSSNIAESIIQNDEKYPNLIRFYPRKKIFEYAYSSFHPKLILIKFKQFLRVIIGSGNLLEQDWIVWENVFISQDYPASLIESTHSFPSQINQYLSFTLRSSTEFLLTFINLNIKQYDFDSQQFHLISSLPARWKYDPVENYGLNRLKQINQTNKPNVKFTFENMSIYYLASSVGNLNTKLILDFASCFLEDNKMAKKMTYEEKSKIMEKFHVLYPSESYVENSKFGPKSASCLFLDKEIYDSFKFQKKALKKYNKKTKDKKSLISHVKMFIVSNSKGTINDDTIIYIGSHNFTTAAWGKFELDNSSVFVSNYEMGVLIPSLKESSKAKQRLIDQFDIDFEMSEFTKDEQPYFSKK